jgi:hypothetical protein
MHAQRSSVPGGTVLLAVVCAMAACVGSGSPLASPDRGHEGTVVKDGGRPATFRGTPLTREQARQKRIVDSRAALAHARSGATIRFSDGRELSGADAVLYRERTLHALESGLSPHSVISSSSDGGYVAGGTMLHGNLDMSWVMAWTDGMQSDRVGLEGFMRVELESTRSDSFKTESAGYSVEAYGSEASTSAMLNWDYNWQSYSTIAFSDHWADYGNFTAYTSTTASR